MADLTTHRIAYLKDERSRHQAEAARIDAIIFGIDTALAALEKGMSIDGKTIDPPEAERGEVIQPVRRRRGPNKKKADAANGTQLTPSPPTLLESKPLDAGDIPASLKRT